MSESTLLKVGPGGQVELPYDIWTALYRQSKIRSKKKRHIKKAVKKQLTLAILKYVEEYGCTLNPIIYEEPT